MDTVESGSPDHGKYLIVRVGTTLYGLPLGRVRRVLKSLDVHPLPGSAPTLLGLGQLGGEPVGVLDLGRLINPEAPATEPGVTVVARVGPEKTQETVALAIDSALEVVAPDAASVARSSEPFVVGEIRVRGGIARILDLSSLGGHS